MKIDKQILQKMLDNSGEYLLVQRFHDGYGRSQDEWTTLIISPTFDRELWGKQIGELPYDKVEEIASTDIRTCINIGSDTAPFQYGNCYKHIVNLYKLTCPIMELIVECYQKKITDYYEIITLIESKTELK